MTKTIRDRLARMENRREDDALTYAHGLEHLFPELAACPMGRSEFEALFSAVMASITGTARQIPGAPS